MQFYNISEAEKKQPQNQYNNTEFLNKFVKITNISINIKIRLILRNFVRIKDYSIYIFDFW
jgi:hypothetical protein